MRIWKVLAVALLLMGCSSLAAGPPVPSSPGPRQLEVVARPDGWTVRPTVASDAGQDQDNHPGDLWWLGPERALVSWWWRSEPEQYLIDLAAGTLNRLDGYERVQTVSPDGRHAVTRGRGETWLVKATTGEHIFRLAESGHFPIWLSPELVYVAPGSSPGLVYDLSTGKTTSLPEPGHPAVLLAEREVCYNDWTRDHVACVPLTGGTPNVLTPDSLNAGAADPDILMASDAGGRYLAFTYANGGAVSARPAMLPVLAVASAKPARMRWANEVAIYDASTRQTTRYPLGGEYAVSEMIWSGNGSYLGLSLAPVRRKGATVTPLGSREFWVLERATGRMETAAEADPNARLLMVTDQGEAIYHDEGGQTLAAAAGAQPRAWAPGLAMFPGPRWGEPPEPLAFVGQGALEVRTQGGATYRWPWEGTDTDAGFSLGPAGEWVALDLAEPRELVFLRR